jgi:hypothetical protein
MMQWLNGRTCGGGGQSSIRAIPQAVVLGPVGSPLTAPQPLSGMHPRYRNVDVSFRLPLVRQTLGSKLDLV